LQSGVSSAADNQREKKRENHRLGNLIGEVAHGGGSEHLTHEKDGRPTRPLFSMSRKAISRYGLSGTSEPPSF
jgi:hypothetical protein